MATLLGIDGMRIARTLRDAHEAQLFAAIMADAVRLDAERREDLAVRIANRIGGAA